jgi:hypothetical protein
MKYGERYLTYYKNFFTGERIPVTATWRYVEWKNYHTNDEGYGLWHGNKQIVGTCQFTVTGCKTEKAAKAKIRRYVTQ